MDIIVTTPKSQMKAAAQEAADCIAAGGGEYFRRFNSNQYPDIGVGDKVYYVEDGYIRGFAIVKRVRHRDGIQCDTTGRQWLDGCYIFMDAKSWQWITPVPMKGFQNFRYADRYSWPYPEWIVGGWLDPKPETHQTEHPTATAKASKRQ